MMMAGVRQKPVVARMLVLLGLLALICVAFQIATPSYLTVNNLRSLLRAMAITGVVSIGLTFVIIVRKFDLSLAGVASLAAMTLGFVLESTGGFWITVAATVGIGVLCGLISGALVGIARLPDVIATIAVGSIAYGAAFFYNDGATYSKNFMSSGLININFKTVLGLQIPVFILLLVTLLAFLLLQTTRFGQAFYAVVENPVAARFSGISVSVMLILAFGICGATVGVSMLLHVAGAGSSFVTAGSQILLPAYTSVYLGSALFARPSVLATLSGTLVMTMLLNGFTLLSVPYYYSDIFVSAVLVVAIILFSPNAIASLRRKKAA